MIETNCPAGSSRRNFSTSTIRSASTVRVSSPKAKVEVEHRAGYRGGDFLADRLQQVVHSVVFLARRLQRSIVPVRRIFFCSIRTP